jgi:hypothetical protein
MGDSIEVKRRIYCVRHGHSRVVDQFWMIHCCARCGEEVGDLFSGFYSGKTAVAVDHNCDICKENAKTLTKTDLAMLPEKARKYVDKLMECQNG